MDTVRLSLCLTFILGYNFVSNIDIRPEINKYCRDKDRLVGSEENDLYLLVDAELNTTISLQCHFW